MNIPKVNVNFKQIGEGLGKIGAGVSETLKGAKNVATAKLGDLSKAIENLNDKNLVKDIFHRVKKVPHKKEIAIGAAALLLVAGLAVKCINKITNKVDETVKGK